MLRCLVRCDLQVFKECIVSLPTQIVRGRLQSRGHTVTSLTAGPGSILGLVNFLNRKSNVTFVPGYGMAIIYHPSTDVDGL